MNDKKKKEAICPICGKSYTGEPALSRKDNATLICPDCGIMEALASLGIAHDEQEQILETIHSHTQVLNDGGKK